MQVFNYEQAEKDVDKFIRHLSYMRDVCADANIDAPSELKISRSAFDLIRAVVNHKHTNVYMPSSNEIKLIGFRITVDTNYKN